MMHAPFLMLALANGGVCDLRAVIAGDLMVLHQSGAPAEAVADAARHAAIPDFAGLLLPRVLVAETAADPEARELAAYHFAARIYAECRDAPSSGA